MRPNENGFSAVLTLLVIFSVIAVPTYFVYYTTSAKNPQNLETNVRGVSTSRTLSTKPGFSVGVVSNSATWNLVEYLCNDIDECLSSLNSGRRLGTVSGGETDLHEVVVEYSADWAEYDYIKYFVRSGWYTSSGAFKVTALGDIPGSEMHIIEDNGEEFEVVVSPIVNVTNSFYSSATFSDVN